MSNLTTLIHPTAVIHPGAELHPTVQVGAYAVIGEKVKVGAGTIVGAHVILDGRTEIGVGNQIFPGAAIGLEPQDLKYDGSLSLVKIGDRNLIREYVTINRPTRSNETTAIGNDNMLMAYVHVAHNCTIEDRVIIANSVSLAGHVYVESGARFSGLIGVHQFVRVGRMAMIGGMSRIERDVPPYMLVEGNPSRVRSLNLVGLKRAGVEDLTALRKAFRLLYRSSLPLNEAIAQFDLLPETEALHHLRKFLIETQQPDRRGVIPGKRSKARGEE